MRNNILLNVTEITKIAVSFHCDIHNIFSTHYCRATAGMNGKMVIHLNGNTMNNRKLERIVNKIWRGVFMKLKLIMEFHTV